MDTKAFSSLLRLCETPGLYEKGGRKERGDSVRFRDSIRESLSPTGRLKTKTRRGKSTPLLESHFLPLIPGVSDGVQTFHKRVLLYFFSRRRRSGEPNQLTSWLWIGEIVQWREGWPPLDRPTKTRHIIFHFSPPALPLHSRFHAKAAESV